MEEFTRQFQEHVQPIQFGHDNVCDDQIRRPLAVQLKSQGWKAIKLRAHYQTLREDVRLVEAVRKAVSDDMEIMVDANQAQAFGTWQPGVIWDFRRAVETARELERLNCVWLEEPRPRYARPR